MIGTYASNYGNTLQKPTRYAVKCKGMFIKGLRVKQKDQIAASVTYAESNDDCLLFCTEHAAHAFIAAMGHHGIDSMRIVEV